MSSLFSSPSKQATAAAQASQQISQQDIQQLEGYVDTKSGQLRDAVGKAGPNPYFAAAQQMNPQAYYTNPNNVVTFSNRGPNTTNGTAGRGIAQQGPPNFPGVIMPAPTQPTQPAPPGGTGGGGGGNPLGGDGNGPIINPITGRPIGGGRQLDSAGNPLPIIAPVDSGSGPMQPVPGQGRNLPLRELM